MDKISQMILALLVYRRESLTVLARVLMERRKSLASSFPIYPSGVSRNSDQIAVRAKPPDGVYRDGWLAHVLRHVEHSHGFRGSS